MVLPATAILRSPIGLPKVARVGCATMLFDPSMSALPIISKQNSTCAKDVIGVGASKLLFWRLRTPKLLRNPLKKLGIGGQVERRLRNDLVALAFLDPCESADWPFGPSRL